MPNQKSGRNVEPIDGFPDGFDAILYEFEMLDDLAPPLTAGEKECLKKFFDNLWNGSASDREHVSRNIWHLYSAECGFVFRVTLPRQRQLIVKRILRGTGP